MTARPLAALVGLALVTGCGAESIKSSRGPAPCPAGTAELGVKDVLPTLPRGTEMIAADPKGARPIKNMLRKEGGKSVRTIYTRVVAKPGRVYGTGVYVVNLTERSAGGAIVTGTKIGADENDLEPQPLTIAGEEAVLVNGPGGVVATGTVGDCAAIALMGSKENEVRAVAERIQRAD